MCEDSVREENVCVRTVCERQSGVCVSPGPEGVVIVGLVAAFAWVRVIHLCTNQVRPVQEAGRASDQNPGRDDPHAKHTRADKTRTRTNRQDTHAPMYTHINRRESTPVSKSIICTLFASCCPVPYSML